MRVAGPLAQVHRVIIDVLEHLGSELCALRNYLGVEEVLHALRLLTLGEHKQLLHEQVLHLVETSIIILLKLLEHGVSSLAFSLLYGTGEETGVDNHTLERWIGLKRSILHVACLVAKDGTQQLLLRSWVALALRCNLADEDITWLHMSTNADDTTLVEVFSGVLAHVGDIAGELLKTALSLAHLKNVLIHVHRSEDILTHHALVEHDGILIVVTLPRHVSHLEIAAQSQLTIAGRITLGENIALLHLLTLVAHRTQIDGGALVGLAELRQEVLLHRLLEAYKSLVLGLLIAYADDVGVNILYNTGALGLDLSAAVECQSLLDASTHNRRLVAHQRHSLAHHVGTHQGAVSVVMLKEWNHGSRNRCNLLW